MLVISAKQKFTRAFTKTPKRPAYHAPILALQAVAGDDTVIVVLAEGADREAAGKIVRLIEALDEHDDTKEVYSNDKISEEVLAKIEDK